MADWGGGMSANCTAGPIRYGVARILLRGALTEARRLRRRRCQLGKECEGRTPSRPPRGLEVAS